MIWMPLLKPIHRLMGEVAPLYRPLLGLLGFLVVISLDVATGAEISFSIFYLAPVLALAWYDNARKAYALAVLSACAWYAAERYGGMVYSHPLIGVWNAGVRLGFFLTCVSLLVYIRQLLEQQRAMAENDGLTGLKNTRAFHVALHQEVARARRYGRSLTLAYVDLDNFKQVNDKWGHETGDRVLCLVADIFRGHLRSIDIPARLGGDEFALVFPETAERDALFAIIDKVRGVLLQRMRQEDWPVTCSIGAVTFSQMNLDVKEMVHVADELMYQVKRTGKNSVLHIRHDGNRSQTLQDVVPA